MTNSVFWNKDFGVIITIQNVNKKIWRVTQIILQIWSYHQRLLTLHFFERSYHNLNFRKILREKPIFWGVLLGQLINNLGLGLGIALTLYTNRTKGLKLKVRNFWVISLTFVEVRRKKPVGGLFGPSILNRVNIDT